MHVPYPSPREHPDYWAPDPCEDCDGDPCLCAILAAEQDADERNEQ